MLKNALQERPIIAYKRNGNLKQIRRTDKILNSKVIRKNKSEKKHIFCSLCYTRRHNRCCQQVEKTNIFRSYKTGKNIQNITQVNK